VAITGSVEVGRPLLELREVLDALEQPLRADEALDVHPAQAGRVDPAPELLRPDVADEVERGVGVAVGVAVEAGHAAARPDRVEALEVALLLLLDLVDVELRERHPALGMVGVGQGKEAERPGPAIPDLRGCHRGESVPGDARRQLALTPPCTGLPRNILASPDGRSLRL